MKITAMETYLVQTPLTESYTIAYDTIDSVTNIFMRLETGSGITGYGCAAPDLAVTGETPEGVLEACDNIILPTIKGRDPLQMARLMEELKSLLKSHPSTAAMLDMALWDILGKTAGLPVYKLLGGYRDSMPTSITIGIMPVDETVEKALDFVKQGFRVLKIKGGSNVETDILRVVKVREAVGEDIRLRFDANQGYSVEQAVEFARGAAAVNIELLEQPTPRDKPLLLGEVKKRQNIPVMADESLMSMEDAFFLAVNGLVDMINIKLMKVGGISEAVRINAVARAAGQKVMAGCMDESALAISAGLQFSLGFPNVAYVDLDGHLDLTDDPARGTVSLKNGILYPSDRPGLGVEDLQL
jgi:L-alanine-DL-glutamate epimerase-like enolase superfamily enzyme